jgi:hypothetical protein
LLLDLNRWPRFIVSMRSALAIVAHVFIATNWLFQFGVQDLCQSRARKCYSLSGNLSGVAPVTDEVH